ncbi:GEVED domain-containing protein [Dokdonia sinensis]|nr:GEVED domain-containing protein [Dokdonia sinensis]
MIISKTTRTIKRLGVALSVAAAIAVSIYFYDSVSSVKTDAPISEVETGYSDFLINHPFREAMKMSKEDRKANGLPPNAYFEQEYLYSANPELLRPTPEKLFEIQEELLRNSEMKAAPGDVSNAWVERGPNNVGGRTRALMFAPGSTTTVFAGGVSGGLWKNNDITSAATQWQQVTGVPGNLSVTCITVDPNNSDNMWIGTGEVYTFSSIGNGIYRSTDGGDTWQSVFTGGASLNNRIAYVQDIIAIDNNGTTEVFFGAGSTIYGDTVTGPYDFPGINAIGLYKSTDGTTFNLQTDAVLQTGGTRYSPNNFDIGADGTLWMGTRNNAFGNGGGFIFSYDGNTWTNERDLGTDGRIEVAASKQDANKIYLLAEDQVDGANPVKIFRTTDAFLTAPTSLAQPNDVDNGIPASDFTRGQSFYDLLLGVDPLEDDIVYVGGIDLFKSTNSGNSWTQISKWSNNNNLAALNVPLIHADQHGIAFAVETGATTGRILFGNDGGVAYTSNGGGDNAHRNNGYNVTQFYKADINQDIAIDKLIAGAQDNGVQFLDGTPESPSPSVEIASGDGCWVFIDEQSQFMLGSFVFNSYSYHNMAGVNLGTLPAPLDPAGNGTTDRLGGAGDFVNQCGLDSDANILFTNGTVGANYQIFRYIIDPSVPSVTSDIIDDGLINHIPTFFMASPYTTDRVLVGTAVGRVLVIDNASTGAPTYASLGNPGGVTGAISDIRYGATENDILVTFHNYGVNNIWYSADAGVTWVSKEGNLPDLPVKAILQSPLDPDEVIVGTDLGIWKTSDWSNVNPVWTQSQNGMSDVKVTSLELRAADNTIVASTYGRGVFTGTFEPTGSICPSNGTTTSDIGITNVSIGDIDNSDGPDKNVGYEDFTLISTTAVVGATCDLSVSVNTDGNNTVEVRVWVDWNNNLDFDDPGEEYDLGTATNVGDALTDASPFALTIPDGTIPGSKRMRVSAKNGSAPTACEIDFDGEVEDYTLIVADYCPLSGNDISEEYIGNVTIGTINNTSTTDGTGYFDYTSPTVAATDIEIGSTPQISVLKVWPTPATYNEAVTVWIDYNQDGDFEDDGETVVLDGASTITPVDTNFSAPVPNDAKLGNTRMRVSLQYSNTAGTTFNTSCGTYNFGETEDYTVNIVAATACSQTRTYNGTWAGGAPTSNEKAVFASNYNTATASIDACEIEVQAGVTVTVSAATYLKAEGNIAVNGTLIVEHEGSVVQVDDAATVTKGAGAVIEVRKTTLSMKPRDFMFAGTPMTGETRDGVYGNVVDAATSTNDQAFRVIYLNPELFEEDPAVANYAPYMGAETFLSVDNTFLGNHTTNEPIVPGEGLVIYPQHSFTADGITTTYDFTYNQGTLNNGVITFPINYNGATEDNFNLLSNPYASAIDIVELMDINPMITEVYFWEHATTPNNSVPGYLGSNPDMMDFSMRNLTTGMAAPNRPGSTPSQYIASGQGFAIKALQAASGTTEVTFNNAMRVTGNNNQYRNTENKELLWLKISSGNYDLNSTAAVGFLPEATAGIDPGYDSKRMATPISIYTSLKSGEQLGIQGREPFDDEMVIPVGVATALENLQFYTIGLDSFEGTKMTETPVYLIDLQKGIYTNLKEQAYTFSTATGNDAERFVITFREPESLGVAEQGSFENSIQLFPNPAKDIVTIAFNGPEELRSAKIVDVQGKLVKRVDLSNFSAQRVLNVSDLATGIYFVEISGVSSATVKKLIVK